MRSLASIMLSWSALERYSAAANSLSCACDQLSLRLEKRETPSEAEIQAVADAKVILAGARRAYGEIANANVLGKRACGACVLLPSRHNP